VLQANAALPTSQQLTTNQLRPYQGYNRILMFLSDSTSNYNALQVYATKRRATSWPRSVTHFQKCSRMPAFLAPIATIQSTVTIVTCRRL